MTVGSYFSHLQRRSRVGWIYRRYWLYPALRSHLKGRILDVGCGLGDMLAYLNDAVGVDINAQAVKWCADRGLNARLMEQDILPFATSTFSSVILDNVLEHIADPSSLLAEIRRVLRPHGVALVGVPGIRGFVYDPDHKVYYDERRLVDRLNVAGFTHSATFFMPFKCEWLNNKIRQYCLYGVFNPR